MMSDALANNISQEDLNRLQDQALFCELDIDLQKQPSDEPPYGKLIIGAIRSFLIEKKELCELEARVALADAITLSGMLVSTGAIPLRECNLMQGHDPIALYDEQYSITALRVQDLDIQRSTCVIAMQFCKRT